MTAKVSNVDALKLLHNALNSPFKGGRVWAAYEKKCVIAMLDTLKQVIDQIEKDSSK